MDWLDLKISIHVEAIGSPWFVNRLVAIEEWWGIPFEWQLATSSDTVTLQPWDNLHVLSDAFVAAHSQPGFNLNLIVCPPQVQTTFLGLYRPWDRVAQIFVTETDHIYQLGKDQGPSSEVMANHEMSHHFYSVLGIPDNTHRHFFAGTPELARDEIRAAFESKKKFL